MFAGIVLCYLNSKFSLEKDCEVIYFNCMCKCYVVTIGIFMFITN